jgi:hypothetical protein
MYSPKNSFKGWDLKKFLKGRKKLIVTLVGAIAGYVATKNPALSAVAGAAAELVYALIEYYVKEY